MKNYAEIIKKGVEDLRGEMRPSSEKRVKTTLVFDAIREKEKIEVTDADLEKEIASWNMPEIKTLEEARKSGRVDLESLRQSVLDRQTVDLLVSLAKISS